MARKGYQRQFERRIRSEFLGLILLGVGAMVVAFIAADAWWLLLAIPLIYGAIAAPFFLRSRIQKRRFEKLAGEEPG